MKPIVGELGHNSVQEVGQGDGFRFAQALYAAHLRQIDELPGARHLADRDLDQRRLVAGEAALQRAPQRFRAGSALSADAEALAQPHEVRIGEVGADHPVAMQALLHVADVAVGAVVEHDDDTGMRWRTAVASSCTLNMKPPSPLIATTGTSPSACLAPSAVATPQPSVPW